MISRNPDKTAVTLAPRPGLEPGCKEGNSDRSRYLAEQVTFCGPLENQCGSEDGASGARACGALGASREGSVTGEGDQSPTGLAAVQGCALETNLSRERARNRALMRGRISKTAGRLASCLGLLALAGCGEGWDDAKPALLGLLLPMLAAGGASMLLLRWLNSSERTALDADILRTLRSFGPLRHKEVAGLCRTPVDLVSVRERLASLEDRGLVVGIAEVGLPGPELRWYLPDQLPARAADAQVSP